MRRYVAGFALLALIGCSHKLTPMESAAGSWPGQFIVESASGVDQAVELEKWTMKGNLWLFVTKDKFRLEMGTAHQSFTVEGKWEAKAGRITMRGDSYEFEFPKEEDQKAMKMPIVTADQIRATFHNPLVFDESPDRKNLTGLKTSLGPLIGKFEFTRPIPR